MEKQIKIALAGNPNSGKTTLFNALTGSNQFVGNWPGVTVEKKEGKLKKHDDVVIMDLPGIYSLSPYTLEEVVSRNYLITERPDAILNIVDGTNLERNLYLTTQLTELGIPVVVAINMMDVVKKNGDQINIKELSRQLGCPVLEISALKGTGIMEAAEAAVKAAAGPHTEPQHTFSGPVEHAIAHIEEAVLHDKPAAQQRWYAIKIFERDDKVLEQLSIPADVTKHIEADIKAAETELDDDAESIITNERYVYIAQVIKSCYKKKSAGKLSSSDKIDKIVTNRWLGLPIFAAVMFIVYWVAMVGVGAPATDWANDGLFGDGWHLLGIGSSAYNDAADEYAAASDAISGYYELDTEAEDFDADAALAEMKAVTADSESTTIEVEDEETLALNDMTVYYDSIPDDADEETTIGMTYVDAVSYFEENGFDEPDPADYGVWVPGVPVLIGNLLDAGNVPEDGWLHGLILDGIVAGVGAVLGFVPQMLVLFLMLAFLEACGYMARIAFVLDRIFRKFGLSGKSFIPMLIGTGCGIPGVMASRTIENRKSRLVTMLINPLMSCSARLPIYLLLVGAFFPNNASFVLLVIYAIGILLAVVMARLFCRFLVKGDDTPFVMELPPYRMPTSKAIFRHTWEKGAQYLRKMGGIIMVASIVIWALGYYPNHDEYESVTEQQENSYIGRIGKAMEPVIEPLGFDWKLGIGILSGVGAKELVVSTLGVLYADDAEADAVSLGERIPITPLVAFGYMVFVLIYFPCIATLAAIKGESGSWKWAVFAGLYTTALAWLMSFAIYQIGGLFL